MKKLFLVALISMCWVAVNAQHKLTDREFDGLKGNVKSVAESSHTLRKKMENELKSDIQ